MRTVKSFEVFGVACPAIIWYPAGLDRAIECIPFYGDYPNFSTALEQENLRRDGLLGIFEDCLEFNEIWVNPEYIAEGGDIESLLRAAESQANCNSRFSYRFLCEE